MPLVIHRISGTGERKDNICNFFSKPSKRSCGAKNHRLNKTEPHLGNIIPDFIAKYLHLKQVFYEFCASDLENGQGSLRMKPAILITDTIRFVGQKKSGSYIRFF